ncbi:MAG: rRNA maturation RNase YbeY [Planctomycetes bacterium]|nr:rRNA maturation RNase YbeY [Planctomycetota bacterium]
MPASRKKSPRTKPRRAAPRCRVTLHARAKGVGEPMMRRLRKHAVALAKLAKLPRGSVAVAIADDALMSGLHVQHTGVKGTTDVLTFDLRPAPSDPRAVLEADLVICIDEAARQAKVRGHSVEDELLLYIVHGMLHLVGHDDHAVKAAALMHRREDELLAKIGIGPIYRS